jgi:sugar phosphate isomerase/epimerase
MPLPRSAKLADRAQPGIPTLSWFPVRHIAGLHSGDLVLEQVLDDAVRFGFSHVELHHTTLTPTVADALASRGLGLSQITCAPDFTHPDSGVRRQEYEHMCQMVERAAELRSPNLRVTAGKAHPLVDAPLGIRRAVRELSRLAEFAAPLGVTLCLENHYRDRAWEADELDFATDPELFLELYRALATSAVLVNFDTGQPMVVNGDDRAMLSAVLPRLANVHLGDRRLGQRQHSVIGEGDAHLDDMLAAIAASGYAGFLTVEDGSADGDDGLTRGLAFVRSAVDRHWGRAAS